MAVPATSCAQVNQSSLSLEFEELFELELEELLELEFDELFEFEFDELFELEFEELLELEFDELFEFELDELFELEFEELLELELEFDEPFLSPAFPQPPFHQPSSSATRTNSSCWFVVVPPGADAVRCGFESFAGSIWRAWAAPVVPRSSPMAAVVSHVILFMGGISLCGFLVPVRRNPGIGRAAHVSRSRRQTHENVGEEDEAGAGRPLKSDENRIVLG